MDYLEDSGVQAAVPVALNSVGVDIYDKGQKDSIAVFLAPPPFARPLPYVLEPGRSWRYHVGRRL
jgi:hypothetical protein